MIFQPRTWFVGTLLASLFAVGTGLVVQRTCLGAAAVADAHAVERTESDDRSGDTDERGSDPSLVELEDNDDESTHRPLTLLILSPDATSSHRPSDDDVLQHPALEPPKPPPRA